MGPSHKAIPTVDLSRRKSLTRWFKTCEVGNHRQTDGKVSNVGERVCGKRHWIDRLEGNAKVNSPKFNIFQ